jgi:flavin-binding protein dodecin
VEPSHPSGRVSPKEGDNAGSRLQEHRSRRVFGEKHRGPIQNAVGRASCTLRQVGWFEVVETRGHVENGKVAHYEVNLKIGFTLEDDD